MLSVLALSGGCGGQKAAPAATSEPMVLRVASDSEFLAFTPTELTCPSGARVRLVFRHGGQRIPQKHNWALVLPGSEQGVEKAGTAAAKRTTGCRKMISACSQRRPCAAQAAKQ